MPNLNLNAMTSDSQKILHHYIVHRIGYIPFLVCCKCNHPPRKHPQLPVVIFIYKYDSPYQQSIMPIYYAQNVLQTETHAYICRSIFTFCSWVQCIVVTKDMCPCLHMCVYLKMKKHFPMPITKQQTLVLPYIWHKYIRKCVCDSCVFYVSYEGCVTCVLHNKLDLALIILYNKYQAR